MPSRPTAIGAGRPHAALIRGWHRPGPMWSQAVRSVTVAACVGAATLLVGETAQATAPAPRHVRRVILLAIPGLVWDDVTASEMPVLRALVDRSAVGLLSVASGEPVTSCIGGALTLGAANRAVTSGTDCGRSPSLATAGRREAHSRYAAQVGVLGSALQAAGVATGAVGPGAGLLLSNGKRVARSAPNVAAAWAAGAVVVAVQTDALAGAGGSRADQHRADAVVASCLAGFTPADLLLVLGTADRPGHARLHVAVATGLRRGALTSTSTGRPPYVQLIDVGPTVMAALGLHTPAAMVGSAMTVTAHHPSVAALVDADRRAVLGRGLASDLGWILLGTTVLAAAVLTALSFGRAPPDPTASLLVAAALLPVASWLAMLLPWWRWGRWPYAVLVVGIAALLTVALMALRRSVSVDQSVAAVCVAVLALDAVARGPLQLSAPLGDSPLVAGRFVGTGNLAAAVLTGSVLVLAAGLATARHSSLAVLVLGAAAISDGLPHFGDDLGGLLTLLLAVPLLGAPLLGVWIRRYPLRAPLSLATAGAALVALVVAHPMQHGHVQRFTAGLRSGAALPVLGRRFAASGGSFIHSSFTVGTLVAAVLTVHRRSRALLPAAARLAGLPLVVAGAVGAVLNDSGTAVPGVMAAVLLPAWAADACMTLGRASSPSSPTAGAHRGNQFSGRVRARSGRDHATYHG